MPIHLCLTSSQAEATGQKNSCFSRRLNNRKEIRLKTFGKTMDKLKLA